MNAKDDTARWLAEETAVNIVRALTDAVPLVRAEGKVLHGGRQVATAEGRIVGPTENSTRTRPQPA
jgi:acyl-coenzyme A thioesterase PaaI-like protein